MYSQVPQEQPATSSGMTEPHARSSYDVNHPASSHLMAMGLNYGQKFIGDTYSNVHSGLSQYVTNGSVKSYFNVNNKYVFTKLKLLVMPYTHTQWTRQTINSDLPDSPPHPSAPREDINAPDLYIPSMAFFTFVILASIVFGLEQRFTPELLGVVASRTFITLGLEVGGIKLCCYLLGVTGTTMLDMVAYASYILVGINISTFMGMCLGTWMYYLCILYFSLTSGFFMLKTLRPLVLSRDSSSHRQYRRYRNYFILLSAICQIPIAFFLGITPHSVLI